MFTNDCLGELEYEATTSAVVMAGIMLAFLLEYIGHRVIVARNSKGSEGVTEQDSQPISHKGESPVQPQQSTLA